MKKIIYSTLIVLLVGGIVFFYLKNQSPNLSTSKNRYDTTALSTVTINQVSYPTAGAVTERDESGELALKEKINLLNKAGYENSSFKLKAPGNGNLTVELFSPYSTSKISFLKWLKDNGYTHINPDQFNYVNISK